jgi:hypothetical protein
MQSLDSALSQLYAVFRDVPVPSGICGCRCEVCISDDTASFLVSTSLRDIPADRIQGYAESALKTVGCVEDYMYFLPRIMEITCRDPDWWPTIEVTGENIAECQPASWPKAKHAALVSLFSTVMKSFVDSRLFFRIDDWLCGIGLAGLDIAPFVSLVESNPAAVAVVYADNADTLPERRLTHPSWKLPNTAHDVLVAWLLSDAVQSAVASMSGRDLWGTCEPTDAMDSR